MAEGSKGFHLGWCCIKLTARDMDKLGQLWLNQGNWKGTQLVSANWVTDSTRPHVEASGGGAEHYGYQWWVTEADGHPSFAAAGLGGQLVEVVPDLDLVVVMSSVEEIGNAPQDSLMAVVSYVIVPALPG